MKHKNSFALWSFMLFFVNLLTITLASFLTFRFKDISGNSIVFVCSFVRFNCNLCSNLETPNRTRRKFWRKQLKSRNKLQYVHSNDCVYDIFSCLIPTTNTIDSIWTTNWVKHGVEVTRLEDHLRIHRWSGHTLPNATTNQSPTQVRPSNNNSNL